MNDRGLRNSLLELLDMGSTHVTLDEALRGLDAGDAFRRPTSTSDEDLELHSAWELLEHMRITQEDILRYTMDATWNSPEWPTGYWPDWSQQESAASLRDREERWRSTRERFERDLEEVRGWLRDESLHLTAPIPHGEGRTYLRQVLLVADHNSYHLAQIVSVRRLLGVWDR